VDALNQRIVLGCDDGIVRLFDSRDGAAVNAIKAHASGIKKVAVSPTNGDILSCAYDQRIRVWDARTFTEKVELEPYTAKWERSFGWSSDGRSILAGTFDGTVVQWNAASGRIVNRVGDTPTDAGNACFNEASGTPDGTVALVADDGRVRLIRLSDRHASLTAQMEPPGGRMLMNAVALDPRSRRVIVGTHDHKLHLFDTQGGGMKNAAVVVLGRGPVNSIRIAQCAGHAGAAFAACYSGAIVRVSPDGRTVQPYPLHDGAVKALRLHPHKALGVSCSANGGLLSWTLHGELVHRFPGHTAIVDDVDFSPNGEYIASASRDFTLNVYRVEDARLIHSIALGRRSPKSLCFWDNDTVIVGDYWGTLLKVDLRTGRIERKTIAANGLSSLSRCGDRLVASSYDGGAYLISGEDLSVLNVYRAMTQRLDTSRRKAASTLE
jgi:WD40 repeat protein